MGEGLQELTSEGRRGGHVQREGKKEVFARCRRFGKIKAFFLVGISYSRIDRGLISKIYVFFFFCFLLTYFLVLVGY